MRTFTGMRSLAPEPYFGGLWEHHHALLAGIGSLLLCVI